MPQTTQKNELIKRRFYEYLKNSERFSAKSVESYEKAIWRWEDFSGNADFAGFNQTAAVDFKEWLTSKKNARSQNNLSASYRYDVLRFLKSFFAWLSKQRGYKHINQAAVDYLNSSHAEARIANQPRGIAYPSVDEIKKVIESIQGTTEVDMRDKALLSLIFLTGARISAVMTLRMKSFDRGRLILIQDPAIGVETKFSKRIPTALFTLSYQEPLKYFLEWFDYLQSKRNFMPDDPIFPATKVQSGLDNNISYTSTGLVEAIFWKSSSTIRKIFEKRFATAGVRYYHPHTFRQSLVKELMKLPLSEEQKKAFSQNLGHEDIGTTFGSYGYGQIPEDRQIELMKSINVCRSAVELDKLFNSEEKAVLVKLGNKFKEYDGGRSNNNPPV